MPEPRPGRSRGLVLAALAALVAGALLYAGTAGHDFVFDDINIVERNSLAKDPADLGGILSSHYWQNVSETGNLYRPLTIWSFALNHRLTGEDAAGHHLTNAALHGLVSGALVFLAGALGLGPGAALAAGLLFATHPIHVEAVAPVVGRSELLAALFVLGAWLVHLRATRAPDGRPAPRRHGLIAAAAALFAAGLLSKENAAILPALVLCGDLVTAPRKDRGWPARLASLGAMTAILILWLLARSAIVPGLPPDDPMGSVFGGIDPWTRILTAAGILGRYAWLLAFPVHLSADYSFHQIPLVSSAANPLVLSSAALYLALSVAGLALAVRRRVEGLALLLYLGAILPVSNLLFSIGTVMGERLLYLPSAGICLLFPALYDGARRGGRITPALKRAATGILLLVVGLYGTRVLTRLPDWKDQHTLFSVTVQTSPRSAKAHYNLGVAEEERGGPEAALDAYRKAIRIKPDMTQAQRNYGLALLQAGDPARALEPLRVAADLDPEIPDLFSDIGVALYQIGRISEAREAFQRQIDVHPEGGRAHYNLGTLLLEEGDPAGALPILERAAALEPEDADIHAQIGYAAATLGQHARATESFLEARRLSPELHEILIPLARSAFVSGREKEVREALRQMDRVGLAIPEDLQALGGP